MSKRITPFASQNTVAITLAADLCTLNFLVTGEDGCFKVMESRFVSGAVKQPVSGTWLRSLQLDSEMKSVVRDRYHGTDSDSSNRISRGCHHFTLLHLSLVTRSTP
ncbi:hypothetical protein PoB_005203500 [Plakobranchus ocellatus]|uniref:Uncharacterized protein n=1 Tax=Plakobranchus ocellatus TaxID=259542 RepID=A0AAV4C2A5_9GAST|nr:hypothetical protein PoB_005203500 [Plakobranchus ocellatus]